MPFLLLASFSRICKPLASISTVLLLISSNNDNFYKAPALETSGFNKKYELSEIASCYGLKVPENASKAHIKKVLDYLVKEEHL